MLPRWLQLVSIAALSVALLSTACGAEVCETCDPSGPSSSGAGGATSGAGAGTSSAGGSCGSTTGVLHGTVAISAPAGDPNSMPSPGAILDLRQKPADVPIHAMADDHGGYSVELPAGSWIVGGESADGYCSTDMPKTVDVHACGSTELEVVLETCLL